jgi:voltage-gated potassium channel
LTTLSRSTAGIITASTLRRHQPVRHRLLEVVQRAGPDAAEVKHRAGRVVDAGGDADQGWRLRLYTIIFEADTKAGHAFDLALIGAILASVAVVVADSVESIHAPVRHPARRWSGSSRCCSRWSTSRAWPACGKPDALRAQRLRPDRPAGHPADLPGFLLPGCNALIDVRVLRLLRIFRLLKLGHYVHEFRTLGQALVASRRKILVFLSFV